MCRPHSLELQQLINCIAIFQMLGVACVFVSVCVGVCMRIGGGRVGWWWAVYKCTYESMFVVVCSYACVVVFIRL